ncbi:hypothetical protein BS47DRAFT_433675 [Hydnum rufescens UP504]|uniref:F-box domain-containing protein n=1 Tax=Hydnum rufescens UP504 TaxID=1448309 RepID=A0A9P6AIM6_9AGAM|nr:hypothetical protein BS47DRAFT_433675 [Hydnum rufescens UP504]
MVLQRSTHLLRLPTEVSERIIVASEYREVARLSQTCRYLYSLIYQREDDDHIWRSLFLNTFDEPRKHNESYDWKLQYTRRIKAAHVLRLVRERYESMEEPWDNTAKKVWDDELIEAFQACAATLRSARPGTTGGDMEFQEFSGSLNLLWVNQNAGAHITYFWPWLLPSEKIAGHELERIPDTSWLASVFMTQIGARWRLMHLAGVRQELSIPNTTDTFVATRLAARAYVYDLRNYRPDTDYGPWHTVERLASSSSGESQHLEGTAPLQRKSWKSIGSTCTQYSQSSSGI